MDIYNAMGANALNLLDKSKRVVKMKDSGEEGRLASKVVEYTRRADDHVKFNEYTQLIKGFFEISQGMKWFPGLPSYELRLLSFDDTATNFLSFFFI